MVNPLLLLSQFLLLLLFLSTAAQTLETRTWNQGGPFTNDYRNNMTIIGPDATVNGGALQLTPDTNNEPERYLVNTSGRILFPTRFKIWEEAPLQDPVFSDSSSVGTGETISNITRSSTQRTVISFNTSFHFNIYRKPEWEAGEGLAFIITSDGGSMPPSSWGQYLGLTNETIDGHPSNHLVAVEFDTSKQSFDPDGNHVGLDINSVVSKVTRSLSDFNITLSPSNGTNHTAWIDYNGQERHIHVYVAVQGKPKPRTPVLDASLDLSNHLDQHSYFGFAGSTGSKSYELNCILGWNLTVEILLEDDSTSPLSWFLRIGVPLLAAATAATAAALVYSHRRRARGDERLVGTLKSLPGTTREFQYKVLKKATANFDEKNRLGQGGFGIVYKGVIPRENTEVAVKMFSRETMQGDFLAELTIINRLRHKHLVRLLGWCHKNGKLLLVYDYMPNGSLDAHLFHAPPGRHLPWDCRYRILTGVASALHYLHNEYDQKVVHRDLKASNVMLDSDFTARLGDFGLARAIDNERTSYAELELEGVPGTLGYIAPECFHTGKATRESDVFGLGAVVLELVCGRRPRCDIAGFRFLADWVWKLHREGAILDAVDPRLEGDYVAEEAERLLLLGLACSHPIPGDRPKTQAVVQIISGSVPPPAVAPFRPAFIWPSVSSDGEVTSTTTAASGSVQANSSFYGSAGQSTQQFNSGDYYSRDISMA